MCIHNPLSVKHFHGVSAGSPHAYLLKSRIGKARIERDLHARSLEVYALPQDVIRCDATTISGAHEVTTGGLWQFGQSKDDPTRPQIKVMMGALDP